MDNFNCGCGENHSHNEKCRGEEPEVVDTLVLTLDDDTEIECEILGVFDVEDKSYIALLPLDEEDSEVLLYEYIELNDQEIDLKLIEDDEEFDKVSKAFEDFFDEDE